MSKSLFFLILSFCLWTSPAFASNLPPRSSGKIYLSENAGNWVYLPKTTPDGQENIICLALASAPPYAVTLRGISGEFGLSITDKSWDIPSVHSKSISLVTNHFHLNKIFYPIDTWTLGTSLSEKEKEAIFQAFSKEKELQVVINRKEHFTLSLKGSAKILSLLSSCLKESHFP